MIKNNVNYAKNQITRGKKKRKGICAISMSDSLIRQDAIVNQTKLCQTKTNTNSNISRYQLDEKQAHYFLLFKFHVLILSLSFSKLF